MAESESRVQSEGAEMYRVKREDGEFDCPDRETLAQWAQEGRVLPETQVFDREAAAWTSVAALLGGENEPSAPPPILGASEQPSGRGSGRSVAVAAIVLLLVAAAAGILGYTRWKQSPTYALAEIAGAVEQHDVAKFREFVDVETVVNRAVDGVLASAMAEAEPATGEAEQWGADLAAGMVELLRPKLVEGLSRKIETTIEATPGSAEDADSGVALLDSDWSELEFKGIGATSREGAISLSTLQFTHTRLGLEPELQLKFRKSEAGHLRMVELVNLADVIDEIASADRQWRLAENEKVRLEFEKHAVLGELSVTKKQDRWGINREVAVKFKLKNTGDRSITAFDGLLGFLDGSGKVVATIPASTSDAGLGPGESASFRVRREVNQFISEDVALWEVDAAKVTAKLLLVGLAFDGGALETVPYLDVAGF